MGQQRRFQFIEDPELVRIAQMGSIEACDELVTRFRGAVLQVARQVLGSQEAAQDVAQETFLIAFRSLSQLQDPAKFAGWLCTIARHRARRVAAKDGRLKATEDSGLEHLLTTQGQTTAGNPLDGLLHTEKQESVRSVLATLPDDLQIVLKLFYYEQWTAARIAEFLSLPLTTIKWRLQSGRRELSRQLIALHKENFHVRQRTQTGDTPDAHPTAEDGGDGRACRANRQLRKRNPQLCQTL